MSNLPDIPFGVDGEGMALKRGRGRPRSRPPISSILNVLKSIEDQALEGTSPDPSLSRKLLAIYACINLERAFLADDKEIPLKFRADMALRIGPVVSMLETLIPKDAGQGVPKTEAAVEQELNKRFDNLNSLIKKNQTPEVEAILDTLAPAAQAPPEEV